MNIYLLLFQLLSFSIFSNFAGKDHSVILYFDNTFYNENIEIRLTNSKSKNELVFRKTFSDSDYHAIMAAKLNIIDFEVNQITITLPKCKLSKSLSLQSIKTDYYILAIKNKKDIEIIIRDSQPVFDQNKKYDNRISKQIVDKTNMYA